MAFQKREQQKHGTRLKKKNVKMTTNEKLYEI